MWIKYNANPIANRVGDCTVRAISKALDQDWESTYMDICIEGLCLHDMPSANATWGSYLHKSGWERFIAPATCPICYTVKDFCNDHPEGRYVLALSGHVVACIDGNYYDTFDSGTETVVYYWQKEK